MSEIKAGDVLLAWSKVDKPKRLTIPLIILLVCDNINYFLEKHE